MATLQRPHRGSRVSSFYPVKSLPPLASLESAFQLQEYISLLIRLDVHDVDAIVALPGKPSQKDQDESPDPADADTKKSEDGDRKSDVSVDRACWIYEQLRRLAQDLSHPLITMLQQECTRSSCPQMKAGEWLYLCVAHGNDGAMEQCCAIDYILHTVDSATALLNSPRAFPSRLSIPQTSHRHFASLARRLGRIFAHAYFHHREAFEQAEAESSLYARFLKLTNLFDLVPAEFLVIPESAIHHDDKGQHEEVEPPRLFSAAVHPTPNIQNDTLTAISVPLDDHVSDTRPGAVDTPINQFGSDSPRKLGRSRTDTMVFSEAFTIAEEPSRNGDGGGLLASPPVAETESLVSGPSWADLETRAADLDDEDTGDARSDLTLTGSLSPPVETLSLISLEDTSAVAMSDAALHGAPSELPPQGSLDETPAEAVEASVEQPVQVADASEDSVTVGEAPAKAVEASTEQPVQVADAFDDSVTIGETSTVAVVEPPPEEASATTSEASTETTEILPALVDHGPVPSSEKDDPIPSSSEEESERPSVAGTPEGILELHEPPPSEPIPPESESDITDEVGGNGGDEQGTSGEEEEAVVA